MPIVEPEVLMDGGHRIARSHAVMSRVQRAVFTELRDQRVVFEHMLLKPSMVLLGYDCPEKASIDEVAEPHQVPAAQRPGRGPGIVFLSGGQSDGLATAHLNAMNRLGDQPGSCRSLSGGHFKRRAAHLARRKRHSGSADRISPSGATQRCCALRRVHTGARGAEGRRALRRPRCAPQRPPRPFLCS